MCPWEVLTKGKVLKATYLFFFCRSLQPLRHPLGCPPDLGSRLARSLWPAKVVVVRAAASQSLKRRRPRCVQDIC